MLGFIAVVGVVEETVKWGAVYLLVYRPGHKLTPLTYMYLGVVAGLAFGVAEAINYSVLYADSLSAIGIAGIGAYTAAALVRLTVLPLLHACMSGISCFFLGLAAWRSSNRAPLILTGLGLAAGLHGLYDGLHSSWVVAGAIVALFIAYVASSESIENDLRELEQGSAAAGREPLVTLRPRYAQATADARALEPISVRLKRQEADAGRARRRLVISAEDVTSPREPAEPGAADGEGATEVMRPALPSVEGVRPPAKPVAVGGGGAQVNLGGTLPNNVIAAAVAALAGWLAFRLFFSEPTETTDLVGRAALEFAVFGGVFGAVVAAWDDARAGSWEVAGRAALAGLAVGAVGGAISGAVAQEIYGKLVKNILESATLENLGDIYSSPKFYSTRALGWAIFGVGVGASLGVAKRSSRKAINAAIGGAVGGALGGLVFHWASIHIQDESTAQLIGFAVVGIGIGVAIGLVEVARLEGLAEGRRGRHAGQGVHRVPPGDEHRQRAEVRDHADQGPACGALPLPDRRPRRSLLDRRLRGQRGWRQRHAGDEPLAQGRRFD